MKRADFLVEQSRFIIGEALRQFSRPVMLWSAGKDSTALVLLLLSVVGDSIPFPLVHIDTGFKPEALLQYRDKIAKEWNLPLRVIRNEDAIREKVTFPDGALNRIECCTKLKTDPFSTLLREGFDGVFVALRADEEGTRSKELFFSPRRADNSGAFDRVIGEGWGYFNSPREPGVHTRVHPLLNWTEREVWRFLQDQNAPLCPLYFADENGMRYRSLGCVPCSRQVQSHARSIDEIVTELTFGTLVGTSERSGRAQDTEPGDT